MKNTKVKYFVFANYECNAIEEFLNEMAMKGWFLETISGSRFKFNKIEPKDLKYSVEPVYEVSTFDTSDSNMALQYRKKREADGWKYICEKDKLQIFYSEENSFLKHLYTNENERFKVLFKSSLCEISLKLLLILIFSFNIYNSLFKGNISYVLTSNLSLLSVIVMFIIIITSSINVLSFIIWSIKSKVAIKNNDLIPRITFKQVKKKNLITKILTLAMISSFLAVLLIDKNSLFNNSLNILIATLMVVIIFLVDTITKKFIKKANFSKETNIFIRILSVLFSFFLIIFVTINTLTGITGDSYIDKKDLSKNNLPLTFADFDESNINASDLYIREEKSILAKEIYYSAYIDDNNFNYSLFESDYNFVISTIEKSLIKVEKRYTPNIIIKESTAIDGIKSYSFSDNSERYIFISNNKILTINNFPKNISKNDFIKIVFKKIFNKNIDM